MWRPVNTFDFRFFVSVSLAALIILAAAPEVTTAGPAPVKELPASALISTKLQLVPKSQLTEVYLVNNSKDKKIAASVEMTQEYFGLVGMAPRKDSVEIKLDHGEKSVVYQINTRYVRVKTRVISASFVN